MDHQGAESRHDVDHARNRGCAQGRAEHVTRFTARSIIWPNCTTRAVSPAGRKRGSSWDGGDAALGMDRSSAKALRSRYRVRWTVLAVIAPLGKAIDDDDVRKVNLNADMAEGHGAWDIGDDTAMLDIITSANVACGFHAGDANVMARACRAAVDKGVSIGAHPGFNDLWGFGRRRIDSSPADVENMTAYQIGALQGIAQSAGTRVTHVKPHGALNNIPGGRSPGPRHRARHEECRPLDHPAGDDRVPATSREKGRDTRRLRGVRRPDL